jgi:hypothetical protein
MLAMPLRLRRRRLCLGVGRLQVRAVISHLFMHSWGRKPA